jgi:murein DD-endopeptidase MepM/ murein hydrolase activator NlpD
MEERSENIGDSGRAELDLRAGQQKVEFGRNPRGEPLSVNESITRYKEAQARRFAEHAPGQREEARGADSAGESPHINSTGGILPLASVQEASVVPPGTDRITAAVEMEVRVKDRRGADNQLNFKDQAADTPPDAPAQAEQPQARDALPEAAPPDRNTLSHDRIPRAVQERPGQLQYSRAPIVPVTTPVKKQKYSGDTEYKPGGTPADPAQSGGQIEEKKPGKLNFGDEDDTPDGKKAKKAREKAEGRLEHSADKVEKAEGKATRSSEKLDKAKKDLPKKKKLRAGKEFDAEKGKLKPRLRFEDEVKSQRDHLRGPAFTRPIKSAGRTATRFAHSQVFQAEHENVGVKAAHRGEMLVESAARSAYRMSKTAPYRKVEKLAGRTTKLEHNTVAKKAAHKKREVKAGSTAKKMQKKRIQRQYAAAARDAKRAGASAAKGAAKTKVLAVKAKALAAKFVTKAAVLLANPKLLLVIGALFFLIIIIFGVVSSCSSMASSIGTSVAAMAYVAEEDCINAVGLHYTEHETDMRILAINAETDHPGYDEYRYSIGAVGHDPFMLMAFLTAVYQDFTFVDIKSVLDEIFNEQYQLTFTPSVETRSRNVTGTDSEGNSYSYTEYYDWHVMTVTLASQPMFNVINPRMTDDQRQQYALLMQSRGLRQFVSQPFAFNWLPFVSSHYGYRVHPISGEKNYHLGIDIGLPTGTEILAGHDGTVTFAGDSGGYGLLVIIDDGNGLVTKYAHCHELRVSSGQPVSAGEVIATVGNTGSSTGPHLHFELLKDGRYMNPLFFTMWGGS